jgi:hypothetical protein
MHIHLTLVVLGEFRYNQTGKEGNIVLHSQKKLERAHGTATRYSLTVASAATRDIPFPHPLVYIRWQTFWCQLHQHFLDF